MNIYIASVNGAAGNMGVQVSSRMSVFFSFR